MLNLELSASFLSVLNQKHRLNYFRAPMGW